MRSMCEVCGVPDYVECDQEKHRIYEEKKRAKQIALPEPEDLLP